MISSFTSNRLERCYAIAYRTRVDSIANPFDAADDLVARKERKGGPGQAAVDDV